MAKKRTPQQTRKIYINKLGMSEAKFQKFFGTGVSKSWKEKMR